jgi:hypothetical protein
MPVSAPTNTIASSPPTAAAETPARTAVSTTSLFANIADERLRTVAEAGHAVFVEAGAIVFRQGEPGVLDGGARDATAEAVAPYQSFMLRRIDFLAAISRAPSF